MPDKPQTRSNHTRFDPLFHFTLVPAATALLIWTIVQAVRHPVSISFIELLTSVILILAIFRMRIYSLRVQDRVIRLEERLRLAMLLPDALRPRISELNLQQLVALRFASDVEIPSLASQALSNKLSGKQIKDAIQSWRADYLRV